MDQDLHHQHQLQPVDKEGLQGGESVKTSREAPERKKLSLSKFEVEINWVESNETHSVQVYAFPN